MFFLSESSIHLFNHCTVAIFRLPDLTGAINEKVKIGCTGIAFTAAALGLGSKYVHLCMKKYAFKQQQHWVQVQCSCPQANLKEKPVQPFNNILLIGCACYCPLWLYRPLLYDG